MKVAVVTDDGKTVSPHFGRASHYLVCTVDDGRIVHRELRDKVGHREFADQSDHDHRHQDHEHDHHNGHRHGERRSRRHHALDDLEEDARGHGFGPGRGARHRQMIDAITDCEALLARGMGRGAFSALEEMKIRPILTDIRSVDDAVQAYIRGEIIHHEDRLH